MPRWLAQQRITLNDLEWPFHASRAISAVAELLVYTQYCELLRTVGVYLWCMLFVCLYSKTSTTSIHSATVTADVGGFQYHVLTRASVELQTRQSEAKDAVRFTYLLVNQSVNLMDTGDRQPYKNGRASDETDARSWVNCAG